jgi:hypothetical protein
MISGIHEAVDGEAPVSEDPVITSITHELTEKHTHECGINSVANRLFKVIPYSRTIKSQVIDQFSGGSRTTGRALGVWGEMITEGVGTRTIAFAPVTDRQH